MGNPFAVDRAYVVSTKALKAILSKISSDEGKRWWIEEETKRSVAIGFSNLSLDGVNSIIFEFPKVANVALFPDGDGEIVCLYPISRKVVQRGLYWEDERLLADEVRDWEAFWLPMQPELERRYSEGPGGVTSSTSISSHSEGRCTSK